MWSDSIEKLKVHNFLLVTVCAGGCFLANLNHSRLYFRRTWLPLSKVALLSSLFYLAPSLWKNSKNFSSRLFSRCVCIFFLLPCHLLLEIEELVCFEKTSNEKNWLETMIQFCIKTFQFCPPLRVLENVIIPKCMW